MRSFGVPDAIFKPRVNAGLVHVWLGINQGKKKTAFEITTLITWFLSHPPKAPLGSIFLGKYRE